MLFNFITISLIVFVSTTALPLRPYRRTASAVIYEEDGVWGSIVFSQFSKSSPVQVRVSFNNIKLNPSSKLRYEIREEPVHYDLYPRHKLCSNKALKKILSIPGKRIGDLVRIGKMKHITDRQFTQTVYNDDISLFEDSPNYIVGRSFVIRQGGSAKDFRCATILEVGREDIPEGVVPCVKKVYEKCLVGTEDPELCVYRRCEGFEQHWGPVDHSTALCTVVQEVYPKLVRRGRGGRVVCHHGRHSLLVPVGKI